MNEVEVSVILPVYNAERYLKDTLDAIMRQTLESFEIIIINDGSKDGTQEIIENYQKMYSDKIRYYFQDNQGQSAARNNALKYVKGKYIAFIDADDLIADWYLDRMFFAAEQNDADIVVCSYQKFVDETGVILFNRYSNDWNVEFEPGYLHVFQYSPCARLCKTEFIKRYGFVFSVGEQLEDGPYCMMIELLSSRTVIVNEVGYFYRVYNESTMGNIRKGNKMPRVPYRGVEAAIVKVKENTHDTIVLDMLEYCSVKILTGFVTNMYKNCSKVVRKKICRYCYYIINKYFPGAYNNPYIKGNRLHQLPLQHRVAVKLFVLMYRLRLLYFFSLVVSGGLRSQEKVKMLAEKMLVRKSRNVK